MKKIFALALAAVMTASMATVAFAVDLEGEGIFVGTLPADVPEDISDNEDWMFILDDGVATDTVGNNGGLVEGGAEIAIPIGYQDEDGTLYWYTTGIDYDKRYVYADWDVNEAEDVEIRLVKYDMDDDATNSDLIMRLLNQDDPATGSTSAVRIYSVVITVPDNTSNKTVDLAGTVAVGKSKSAAKSSEDIVEVGISYTPNGVVRIDDFDGSDTLYSDTTGIVDFEDDAGEIDIEFGDDAAMFTVNVTGQSKLNLAWNTDYDKEFAALYDDANIDFITWEGKPSFNKTGTLYIYADEDTFLYEVTADGAKAVDAEWDEDYEAWVLKTRTLSAYAISDMELDTTVKTEDENTSSTETEDSTTTDDGTKPNPDTGR